MLFGQNFESRGLSPSKFCIKYQTMNTPTHALLSYALLKRGPWTSAGRWLVAGGILPDLPMFLFYGWVRFFEQKPEKEIWETLYFQAHWQTFFDLFNSIPLILLGFGICWILKHYKGSALCASMLLHCSLDFPFHHDDGHRHFWPFSEYRFSSPISYWDPHHYGTVGAGIELCILTGCTFWIFRQLPRRWWHWVILFLNIIFMIVYGYFYST